MALQWLCLCLQWAAKWPVDCPVVWSKIDEGEIASGSERGGKKKCLGARQWVRWLGKKNEGNSSTPRPYQHPLFLSQLSTLHTHLCHSNYNDAATAPLLPSKHALNLIKRDQYIETDLCNLSILSHIDLDDPDESYGLRPNTLCK